jgi:hypothetical protein
MEKKKNTKRVKKIEKVKKQTGYYKDKICDFIVMVGDRRGVV